MYIRCSHRINNWANLDNMACGKGGSVGGMGRIELETFKAEQN